MYYENLTKEKTIEFIKSGYVFFEDINEKLKDDKDVVMAAVLKNVWSLKYASDRLKDNKEIVLEAVKQDGRVLKYASNMLKNNREIILEAVMDEVSSLIYASEELQNDKEVLEILEKVAKENNDDLYFDINSLWYKERMEALANIREKELMENSIINSNIKAKKMKF